MPSASQFSQWPPSSPDAGNAKHGFPPVSSSRSARGTSEKRRGRPSGIDSYSDRDQMLPPSPSTMRSSVPESPAVFGDAEEGMGGNLDDQELDGDDADLPKDLGVRTWQRILTKNERAKRPGFKNKIAVLSIQ